MNFESLDLGVGIRAEGTRFLEKRRRNEQGTGMLDGAREAVDHPPGPAPRAFDRLAAFSREYLTCRLTFVERDRTEAS